MTPKLCHLHHLLSCPVCKIGITELKMGNEIEWDLAVRQAYIVTKLVK